MKSGKITVIRKAFSAGENTKIADAVLFVGEELRRLGVGDRPAIKTEMAVEETALLLQRNAPENSVLQVRIERFFGDLSVTLTMAGEEFDPFAYDEEQSEDAIRSVFLRSFGENYKYRYKRHEYRVRILVKKRERSMLVYTLVAMALGLLFGLLASFVLPAGLTEGICAYVLQPVKTVFMNALKIIIAPVVFFSIVTCISQFSSIAELGKMGAKVMGMYTLTTVIAVCLGIACFQAFHPGAFGFALAGGMEQAAISVDTGVDTSLLSTIVNIVPSNFLAPFLESDTLQIIFLAVICGVAVGMIGEYASVLKEFFEACNSLFLTITTIFSKAIPLAVFASMALLIVEVGGQSLLPLLGYAGVVILAVMLIIGIYPAQSGHVLPEKPGGHADQLHPGLQLRRHAREFENLHRQAGHLPEGVQFFHPARGDGQHGRSMYRPVGDGTVSGTGLRRHGPDIGAVFPCPHGHPAVAGLPRRPGSRARLPRRRAGAAARPGGGHRPAHRDRSDPGYVRDDVQHNGRRHGRPDRGKVREASG